MTDSSAPSLVAMSLAAEKACRDPSLKSVGQRIRSTLYMALLSYVRHVEPVCFSWPSTLSKFDTLGDLHPGYAWMPRACHAFTFPNAAKVAIPKLLSMLRKVFFLVAA